MGLNLKGYLLGICLIGSASSVFAESEADPWEPLNRKIYAFNDIADRYLLLPVAKSYQAITPQPVDDAVSNVFDNALEVTTILNGLLQFKVGQAGSDLARFLVNSTIGLVGIFDVASSMGLEKHQEDFGQTLGYWGFESGPYLVLPLLGPSSLRDGVGLFADGYSDLVRQLDHVPTRNSLWGTRIIDDRADLIETESLISGDRYVFIRDAYLQRRHYLVSDGVVEDDFGDESFEDWE